MELFLVLGCLAVAIVICYGVLKRNSGIVREGLKPVAGPRSRPLVGNSLQVEKHHIHQTFEAWKKEYGSIFKCKILGTVGVYINDIDLLKKAFSMDAFNDRPKYVFSDEILLGHGLAFGRRDDVTTDVIRQAILTYSSAQLQQEKYVTDELQRLVRCMENTNGVDFDFAIMIRTAYANILSNFLTGEPAQQTDSKILWDFMDNVIALFDGGYVFMVNQFPFLRRLPGTIKSKWNTASQYRDALVNRYRGSGWKVESDKTGYLNYLNKLKEENDGSQDNPKLLDQHIAASIPDIIAASLAAGSNNFIASVLLLLKHPDVMKRVQEELDTTLTGTSELMSADMEKLPFTRATVMESVRHASIVHLSVPHFASQDTDLAGYLISKDTQLFGNIWGIHHDEDIWGDPFEFRPERFLDSEGKVLPPENKVRQAFIPFCVPRRHCPAGDLAVLWEFLFVATILRHFDMFPPTESQLPSHDSRDFYCHAALVPPPYKCRIVPRNQIAK
ncbi:MAG: cytochrome P450 [Candidatus Thiodiazotropha sp.]